MHVITAKFILVGPTYTCKSFTKKEAPCCKISLLYSKNYYFKAIFWYLLSNLLREDLNSRGKYWKQCMACNRVCCLHCDWSLLCNSKAVFPLTHFSFLQAPRRRGVVKSRNIPYLMSRQTIQMAKQKHMGGSCQLFSAWFDSTAYSDSANIWCLNRSDLHVMHICNLPWGHSKSLSLT